MNKQKVSVVLRVRDKAGKRTHHAAVFAANYRLKPNYGVVAGKPQHLPGSVYYLRYTQAGKRVWERVGSDATLATIAKDKCELKLRGIALGLVEPAKSAPSSDRLELLPAIHEYCRNIALVRNDKTARGYNSYLTRFSESCGKRYVDEITRTEVKSYIAQQQALKPKPAPKSIHNHLVALKAFLRHYDFTSKIVVKSDLPKINKKLPRVYSQVEIDGLLAASPTDDRLVWETFLASGMREAELSHLCWDDIDFARRLIHLSAKPDLAFNLKDFEERQIPIPTALVAKLAERRAAHPKDRLCFPTADGKPEGHFLRRLKQAAASAAPSMNCGRCKNRSGQSCATNAVCKRWTLHSFRRTAATRWHEKGLSVPSVQKLLGHSRVETTLLYLAGQSLDSDEFRLAIDAAYVIAA